MNALLKTVRVILYTALASVLLVMVVLLGIRAYFQHRDAAKLVIHTSSGISEARYVRIGGIDQWIQIRGQNLANPVVLLLNGGPGASWIRATQALAPWEKFFTIVQWDQRGAGRTFAAGGDSVAPTMTVARMTSDTIEVINYLRGRLKKDKIILLGHSWGSILGIHVAQERPDLLYCFVGTGQVESMPKVLKAAYGEFLADARRTNHRQAISEIEALGPPPYANYQSYVALFKWAGRDRTAALQPKLALPLGGFAAPDYSLADIYYFWRGFAFSQQMLFPLAAREDLPSLGLDFKVPIVFIEGTNDAVNPMADAEDYFDRLTAPEKDFVKITGGTHFVLFENPESFLTAMLAHVRPLLPF